MPVERPVEGPVESVTPRIPAPAEPPTDRLTPVPQHPLRAQTTETPAVPAPADTPPTELRIHGVSGTPAEDMLDRHIIGRVAGDAEAGFFRPRTEYGAVLGPGGARLEAYRWGNLTAGAAARAFWLLLLPFTLVNVPMWMRPPAKGAGRRIVHGLCRLFALTLSGTFTLAAVGITMDLVAWQCAAPEGRCLVDRPWLTVLFTGFFEPTGRRMALAALGPILVISVLWFLARRTWARYESYELPERQPDRDGLGISSFWDGREQVGRLRSLHVAAMFAIVDLVLLGVLLRHDTNPGTDAYAGVELGQMVSTTVVNIGRVVELVALGVLALSVILLFVPAMVDRVSRSRTASAVAAGLRWLSLLVTAASLAYALVPRAKWPTAGPMPGYADTVTLLFAGQAGLLGLLMLVVLLQRHRAKGALLGGFGAPIVASLGLGLGAALSAGISYRVSDFLDKNAVPSPAAFGSAPESLGLQPPVSYQWAAFGFVVMVLVVILTAIWVRLVAKPLLRRRACPDTDDDYPGGRERNRHRAKAIDTAVANARVTDHIAKPFVVAWLILALAGVAATGAALFDIGPVQLGPNASTAAEVLSLVTRIGTYLISAAVLGLVLLGVQTYRNARVRRTVGVIWDLGTFWPRAAHPLAPPCYAERVVPEMAHRAEWLATQQGGLILSGHSQGSILAAATVLQLSPETRRRTALLTYGSPLCRLYLRAFPNYFNERVVNDIGAALTGGAGQVRWVNLWRRTDPIGGAVGIGDRRLADPVSFDPLPGDRLAPGVQAHSGYQVTREFGQAMDDLVGLLREHAGTRQPLPESRSRA
jgi:hypothetical protein